MNFHGKGAIYPQRTDDAYIYEKERLFFYSTMVTRSPLNTPKPNLFMMNLMASCALTEFPASSKGGAKADAPNTPGNTAITPPPTPLLAGIPAVYIQSPECS